MYLAGIFLAEILLLYILARNLHLGFGRLFYKITKSHKWTSYLLAILFLPGTLFHELSHFLTALFLLVPVGEIELIPEIEEAENGKVGVRLGGVGIGKCDPFRRFLIGIAPLIFGVFVIPLVIYWVSTPQSFSGTPGTSEWWKWLLAGYVVFEVGITMFSSKKDLEGSWKALLVIAAGLILLYLSQVNIVLSDKVVDLLKRLDIFMAVPIIINTVFVVLFRLFKLI